MHTFSTFKYSFTREEIIEFNGPPLVDTFRKIDPDRVDELVQTYREHNLREHDRYVKAFPYVHEVLNKLKEHGLKIGIVTSKMRGSVERGLDITNLNGYFDTIITLDDVSNPKPHPEPVVRAMEDLQATASSAIRVRATAHDIEAAQNVGVSSAVDC